MGALAEMPTRRALCKEFLKSLITKRSVGSIMATALYKWCKDCQKVTPHELTEWAGRHGSMCMQCAVEDAAFRTCEAIDLLPNVKAETSEIALAHSCFRNTIVTSHGHLIGETTKIKLPKR